MTTTHIGHRFSFTTAFTEAVVPVGQTYFTQGRGYVFVLNAGADSLAAGDVVSVYDSSGFTYGSVSTTDATEPAFSDGTTNRALVAGIAGATVATNEYCWLWFYGHGTHAITTDGNVAAFQEIVCADNAKEATPNTTAATAHHLPFGYALAADSSTTLSNAALGGSGMFPWGGRP